jgi:hypothetical protein
MVDPCVLVSSWGISYELAVKVAAVLEQAELELGRTARIISGFRTCEKQMELAAAGRPAVACGVSTHTSCPATGVDLSIGALPTNVMKATLGRIAVFHGLRWGGGSLIDPQTGIPSDWNHFDLGPRRQ